METSNAKPRESPPPGVDIVPLAIVELVGEVFPGTARDDMLDIIVHRMTAYQLQGRLDLLDAYKLTEQATLTKMADVVRKQKRRDLLSVVGKATIAATIGVGLQLVAFQFGLYSIW